MGRDGPREWEEPACRTSDTLRAAHRAENTATRLIYELDRSEPPTELYRAARFLEQWRGRLG